MSSTSSGAATYSSLGQIGFKTERDGTITVDEAKLSTVLSTNYADVKALVSNQGSVAGLAQSVSKAVDALTDVSGGVLTLRKNGVTSQVSQLGDEIARKQDSVNQYQDRLKLQYAALDALLSQLKGQSSFLQSQSTQSQQS